MERKNYFVKLLLIMIMGMFSVILFGGDDDDDVPDRMIDLLIVIDDGVTIKSTPGDYLGLTKKVESLRSGFGEFKAGYNSNFVFIDSYNYRGLVLVELESVNSNVFISDSFIVNGSGSFQLNISDLDSGVYILSIETSYQTYSGEFKLD